MCLMVVGPSGGLRCAQPVSFRPSDLLLGSMFLPPSSMSVTFANWIKEHRVAEGLSQTIYVYRPCVRYYHVVEQSLPIVFEIVVCG